MLKVIAGLVLISWVAFTCAVWVESRKPKHTSFCDLPVYWRLVFSLFVGALVSTPGALALLGLGTLICTIFDVPFR